MCGKTLGPMTHGLAAAAARIVTDARSSLDTADHLSALQLHSLLLFLAKGFQLLLALSWSSSNFPDTRPDPPESCQAPVESLRSHLPSALTKV